MYSHLIGAARCAVIVGGSLFAQDLAPLKCESVQTRYKDGQPIILDCKDNGRPYNNSSVWVRMFCGKRDWLITEAGTPIEECKRYYNHLAAGKPTGSLGYFEVTKNTERKLLQVDGRGNWVPTPWIVVVGKGAPVVRSRELILRKDEIQKFFGYGAQIWLEPPEGVIQPPTAALLNEARAHREIVEAWRSAPRGICVALVRAPDVEPLRLASSICGALPALRFEYPAE